MEMPVCLTAKFGQYTVNELKIEQVKYRIKVCDQMRKFSADLSTRCQKFFLHTKLFSVQNQDHGHDLNTRPKMAVWGIFDPVFR